MPNFMEQLAYQHSQKNYQQAEEAKTKLVEQGERIIRKCIEAIKRSVEEHYTDHAINGYLGSRLHDVHDDIEMIIIPESSIKGEEKKTYSCVEHLEDDSYIIEYVKEHLPAKIQELGITRFSIDYELKEVFVRNNRDLLSWNKYTKTGQKFYIIHMNLQW